MAFFAALAMHSAFVPGGPHPGLIMPRRSGKQRRAAAEEDKERQARARKDARKPNTEKHPDIESQRKVVRTSTGLGRALGGPREAPGVLPGASKKKGPGRPRPSEDPGRKIDETARETAPDAEINEKRRAKGSSPEDSSRRVGMPGQTSVGRSPSELSCPIFFLL